MNKTPRVPGPQWLEITPPARVSDFTEDSETFEIGANRIYNGWLTAGMCDKHAIRTRML